MHLNQDFAHFYSYLFLFVHPINKVLIQYFLVEVYFQYPLIEQFLYEHLLQFFTDLHRRYRDIHLGRRHRRVGDGDFGKVGDGSSKVGMAVCFGPISSRKVRLGVGRNTTCPISHPLATSILSFLLRATFSVFAQLWNTLWMRGAQL